MLVKHLNFTYIPNPGGRTATPALQTDGGAEEAGHSVVCYGIKQQVPAVGGEKWRQGKTHVASVVTSVTSVTSITPLYTTFILCYKGFAAANECQLQ